MNIEIEIKDQGISVLATVSIDGVEMLTRPFPSVEDAEKWAESRKSDIKRLAKECDCPKCRAYREAQTAKPEPEEPAPTWTPEVGMLVYMPKTFGHEGIYEITHVDDGWFSFSIGVTSDYFVRQHISNSNCKPIAELEGLKVGESVYAISRSGDVHEYRISGDYDKTFWVASYDVRFPIGIDGVPFNFGNGKQMFWRTKERAERFGK